MDTLEDEDQQERLYGSVTGQRIEVIENPFQVVLIGDSGVGKTSFLIRFSEDTFLKNLNTSVGIDFRFRSMIIDDKQIKLKIWDTAGQESFRSLSKRYFQKADAALIFFDISNSESFRSLEYWLKVLSENCKDPNIPKFLIGHKCDLTEERQVEEEEILDFVQCQQQLEYYEASAKDNLNVITTFAKLAQKFIYLLEDGQLNFAKTPLQNDMMLASGIAGEDNARRLPNCKCCLID